MGLVNGSVLLNFQYLDVLLTWSPYSHQHVTNLVGLCFLQINISKVGFYTVAADDYSCFYFIWITANFFLMV